jgi:Ni/Fe-hydrogenase 1 B-type cytochrome subunit
MSDVAADHDPKSPPPSARTSVYVYEAPVRIWHWLNALAIIVLMVTGYFIGQPPPSLGGEASDHFLMGYIRFVHFAAGQLLAVLFLGRIYWAFVGNHHARQIFTLPLHRASWWREIWIEIKWYAFLTREPKKYEGHNPLAHLAMFVLFTLTTTWMVVSGLALYSEGLGRDSLLYTLFGWVLAMPGGSFSVHTLHRLGMWVLVIFVMVHIYAAIREDIMSRQSIVSTMVSGERMFKDNRP